MLTHITTSIVAAAIISVGASVISVKVMGADLDRAKADLAEVSRASNQQSIAIAEMRAVAVATTRSDGDRWEDVKRRLTAIEARTEDILSRLGPRRDTGRNR